MSDRLPVSVFIIAQDEADRIGRVVAAVRDWVDEVVVVDSGSRDGTQAIAESLGARVIHNPWPGYGPQKRFAENQCRNRWLFNLDADEEVGPELAAEIRALFAQGEPQAPAYAVKVVNMLPGQERPTRGAYYNVCLRLYDRTKGRFSDSLTHDSVILAEGAAVPLNGWVLHRSLRSLSHYAAKQNAYTDLQATELLARGKRFSAVRLLVEMPAAFVKYYVQRRLYVYGMYGISLAMTAAYFRFMRLAKLHEARHFPETRKALSQEKTP